MPYEIKLPVFEGPLDLLLHLIARAQISIEDIFVSDVTSQYLEYVETMKETDMESVSEFISLASTLILIKSKSLLPVESEDSEEIEEMKLDLIERLKIYKAYKDICTDLKELEHDAEDVFYKLPEEIPDLVSPVVWEEAEVSLLLDAYRKVLQKKKENAKLYDKVSMKHDSFSVRVQSRKIMSLLKNNKKVRFSGIFTETSDPMEIAVTFVALLQLWHDRKISVSQNRQFDEIYIMSGKEG